MGQTMRLDEHHDLLMAFEPAMHMACTGPGSSAKQARHDLHTINTTFGTEGAGRPPARIARLFRYQLHIIPPLRQNQPRSTAYALRYRSLTWMDARCWT